MEHWVTLTGVIHTYNEILNMFYPEHRKVMNESCFPKSKLFQLAAAGRAIMAVL